MLNPGVHNRMSRQSDRSLWRIFTWSILDTTLIIHTSPVSPQMNYPYSPAKYTRSRISAMIFAVLLENS